MDGVIIEEDAPVDVPAAVGGAPRLVHSPSGELRVMYEARGGAADDMSPYGAPLEWVTGAWADGDYTAGYDAEWGTGTSADDYGRSYCMLAASTLFCAACRRGFGSAQGVLQHLRDHQAHRDSVEAAEAEDVLARPDEFRWLLAQDAAASAWESSGPTPSAYPHDLTFTPPPGPGFYPGAEPSAGYWAAPPPPHSSTPGDGSDDLVAPPSDAYTGSDAGSGLAVGEERLAGGRKHVAVLPTPMLAAVGGGGGAGPKQRSSRARRRAAKQQASAAAIVGATGQAHATVVDPSATDVYERAFPPLGGGSAVTCTPPPAVAPAPVWAPAAAKSLRPEASEYQPPAVRPSVLRADAPVWQPIVSPGVVGTA